jgi:formate hydrogenlyase subunit 6/NADH:ubiquinone oxidoreductase subunit I
MFEVKGGSSTCRTWIDVYLPHIPEKPFSFRRCGAGRGYCGFCEEACPTDAIVLTRTHEFHLEQRGDEIINKAQLLAGADRHEARNAVDRAPNMTYR